MKAVSVCLIVVAALCSTRPLAAQSLVEAAEKAKEERAKGMGWPARAVAADVAVKEAPLPAPAADGSTAATPVAAAAPSTAATTPAPSSADPGHPTDAQLKELQLTDMRVTLQKAKAALRDGEKTLTDLKQQYSNMCSHGGSRTWELMDICASMNADIEITWPGRLRRSRDSIRDLEAALAAASR